MTADESSRTLICIPIAHSRQDMGDLGGRLPTDKAYLQRAEAFWVNTQRQVMALDLAWQGVRVYQDGLPDAASEIVRRILAEVQSPNYELLRWLVSQGAEVVGTESLALIKEEYERLRAVLTAKNTRSKAVARRAYAERAATLLRERDRYIAQRIVETLPPEGIGLLFIGEAHCVQEHLPGDVGVRVLRGIPQALKDPPS